MTLSHPAGISLTLGGLVVAALLSPVAANASTDSVFTPLINTTCSYDQVVKALPTAAPDLAVLFNEYPQAQWKLQQFLAMPIPARQQRVDQQLGANPQINAKLDTATGQQGIAEATQVANTCHNY